MKDVLIGCRTTPERGGRGTGITVADASTWTVRGTVNCSNPSFLIPGRAHDCVYVAHGDSELVSRAVVAGDGGVSIAQTVACGGRNPVHLSLDPSGRRLIVVNHSGTVVTLPIGADGGLGAVGATLTLDGTPGPHRTEQGRTRPHQVVPVPGTDLLYVPDKGLDLIWVLRLDAAAGELAVAGQVKLRELTGPRHLALHPTLPCAYVIGELGSSVTVLDCTRPERPMPVQVRSSLSPDDVRDSRGAAVVVSADGDWVCVTNRSGAGEKSPAGPGEDTVGCFPVEAGGLLGEGRWVTTGGQHPRFACWHGTALYVGNEWTDTVTRIPWSADGPGQAEVVFRTGTPTCVVFR